MKPLPALLPPQNKVKKKTIGIQLLGVAGNPIVYIVALKNTI